MLPSQKGHQQNCQAYDFLHKECKIWISEATMIFMSEAQSWGGERSGWMGGILRWRRGFNNGMW